MLQPGTIIDERYEIISTLGVGGFGAVYKAEQRQLNRLVAIKTLNTTLLQEGDGLGRFEREAKAINALKHVNIVGFYGYGVWENAPYMVMELVEGASLHKLLVRGAIEEDRAVTLISQVLEGLACAHTAGVVHRDLKPTNIIVTPDDHVKIIDFGLARLMPGYGVPGQKLTETGYALGTCHYMPPEQALGQGVDQRADIYSTGCVFYQMLTNRVPLDADSNVAVMFRHLNELPEPLHKFLPASPMTDALWHFILNCIAKRPDDRYQDCSEALKDLQSIQKGELSKVQPRVVPRRSYGLAKAKGRKLLTVAVAAVTTLLVGAAAVVYTVSNNRSQPVADEPVLGDGYSKPIYDLRLRLGSNPYDAQAKMELTELLRRHKERKILSPGQELSILACLAENELHTHGGKSAEAIAMLHEILAIRRGLGDNVGLDRDGYYDSRVANTADWAGDHDVAGLLRNFALRSSVPFEVYFAKHTIANDLVRKGEYAGAENVLRTALVNCQNSEWRYNFLCVLSEAMWGQGNKAEAKKCSLKALDYITSQQMYGAYAAYLNLSRLAFEAKDYHASVKYADKAMAELREDEQEKERFAAARFREMSMYMLGAKNRPGMPLIIHGDSICSNLARRDTKTVEAFWRQHGVTP